MCKFCELDKFGDGKEITRNIMTEPIDVGNLYDVFRLEAWLMSGETGDDAKLQICLSLSETGSDISTMDIPINYCPKCGRKLK